MLLKTHSCEGSITIIEKDERGWYITLNIGKQYTELIALKFCPYCGKKLNDV